MDDAERPDGSLRVDGERAMYRGVMSPDGAPSAPLGSSRRTRLRWAVAAFVVATAIALVEAKRVGNGRNYQIGIGDRGQVDETSSVSIPRSADRRRL